MNLMFPSYEVQMLSLFVLAHQIFEEVALQNLLEGIMPKRKIIKGLFTYSEEFVISLILCYNYFGP
jgi:hypothetical protein